MIVVAIVISNTVFNRTGVAIIEAAVISNTVFNRTVVAMIAATVVLALCWAGVVLKIGSS